MRAGRRLVPFACLALSLAAGAAASAGGAEALKTRATLRRVADALDAHLAATGELPGGARELGVVVRLRATKVPIRGGLATDDWGTPLGYAPGAEGYRLWSAGPDRRDEGGEGDDLALAPGSRNASLRRAQSLLPVALLGALAPIAWAMLRRARRGL